MKTLRWTFLTVGLAGLAILAGTRAGAAHPGHAPSTEELTQSARSIERQVQKAEQTLQELDRRLGGAGRSNAAFQAAAAVHALDRTAAVARPPEGKVALHLGFQYQPASLPGRGLEVYQVAPLANSLWAMEALPAGQPAPRGAQLAGNTLILSPGEARLVTIVYDNPTPRDVGFLVLPHQESPGSLGPQTWVTCLCMAFVYEAPARGSWYRVIQVKVSPDMPAGSRVDVLWPVLTDPAVFPTDSMAMALAAPPVASGSRVIESGAALAQRFGCAACHSSTGAPGLAPTWKGLYGRLVTFADGSTGRADEAYLRRSILEPNAQVAKGYPPGMMPNDFGRKLSDVELEAFIAYIKALR